MKKKKLPEEQRKEMYLELSKISSAREARAFHKKYIKYGHEYGLPFMDRYPNLHLLGMVVSLVISLASIIISCIAQL